MKKKPSDYIRCGWCQENYARTKDGRSVFGDSPAAVEWCLIGALYAVFSDDEELKLVRAKLLAITNMPLASWNDVPGRTKEEVIELLEKAGL